MKVFAILTFLLMFFTERASSYAAFSYDTKSGDVIFAKNELEKIYPASLTKIMTIYLAIDAIKEGKFSLFDKVEIPYAAQMQPKTSANLRFGDKISIKDLIMLVGGTSANDAAYTLAYHVGGENVGNFILMMNQKALEIGMQSTHFTNPNGLHDSDQYSSARDLAILMQSFVKNHSGYLGGINSNNFFLHGKYYQSRNPIGREYKCIKAHKTGFTNASGYNIMSYSLCGKYSFVSNVIGLKTSAQRNDYFAQVLNYTTQKLSNEIYKNDRSFYMQNEQDAVFFASSFFVSIGFLPLGIKNRSILSIQDSLSNIYNDYLSEHFGNFVRSFEPFPKFS